MPNKNNFNAENVTQSIREMAVLAAPVAKQFAAIQQAIQPTITPIVNMVYAWQEMFRPMQETIAFINAEYFSVMTQLTTKITRPLMAIDKLKKNQYVHWMPLTNEQIDNILINDEIDKVLYNFETSNDNAKINNTIKECISCKLLHNHQRIFEQAISAYHREDYDISIVAMFSIIDGLLTRYSGNLATGMKERSKQIFESINEDVPLNDDEFSVLILYMTFCATIESLSKSIHFSQDEPRNLNRHWVMHGRSTRDFTALDCMKLVNCIYGILLIGNMQKEENAFDN